MFRRPPAIWRAGEDKAGLCFQRENPGRWQKTPPYEINGLDGEWQTGWTAALRERYGTGMDFGTIITCAALMAVDGDTIKCDGQNMRPMGDGAPYVSGFDTPELSRNADCPAIQDLKHKTAEILINVQLLACRVL